MSPETINLIWKILILISIVVIVFKLFDFILKIQRADSLRLEKY